MSTALAVGQLGAGRPIPRVADCPTMPNQHQPTLLRFAFLFLPWSFAREDRLPAGRVRPIGIAVDDIVSE